MKLLIASLLYLTSTALADKTFDVAKGKTSYDCAKDPAVVINASSGAFSLSGACKSVTVNGSSVQLGAEDIDELVVNGSSVKVIVTAVSSITVNGSSNQVAWQKGKSGAAPKVTTLGTGNKVAKAP